MIAWLHALVHGVTVREAITSTVDILVVAYLVYRGLLLVKGTRAAQMLTGLVLVAVGFYLARVFELSTLLWLLDSLINYSIIFVIVIFQQDIRRGLTSVGANLFGSGRQYEETYVFEEVIRAAEQLARTATGALIVLQREAELDDFLSDPGETVDARVSKELLVALFVPSPQNTLHDGAVIIRDRRLFRAGCVMPLSANRKLDKSLGTRHRAAIGITEETDAVVVVVSEERGAVSLCFGGNIAADLDPATLRNLGNEPVQLTVERNGQARQVTVDPGAVALIMDFLSPADFLDERPRWVYEAVLALYAKGDAIDYLTICNELRRRNRLDEIGGASYVGGLINATKPADVITVFEQLQSLGKAEECGGLAYLNALAQSVPSAANLRRYAEIVRERAILRKLIAASDEIATTAFNTQGRPVTQILDEAEGRIFKIGEEGSRNRQGFQGIDKLVVDRKAEVLGLHFFAASELPQPEGLTFLPGGELAIASEGAGGAAVLRVYAKAPMPK